MIRYVMHQAFSSSDSLAVFIRLNLKFIFSTVPIVDCNSKKVKTLICIAHNVYAHL